MFVMDNGFFHRAGVTQLVECDLAKVDVAGSNPVSRSRIFVVRNPPTSSHSDVANPQIEAEKNQCEETEAPQLECVFGE